MVMLAAGDGAPAARQALETLCRSYWYPLFGHLRARGHSRHEAEDLLQAFFVHLFEKQPLGRADPLKGSFRGFLLGCLKYFLANQRDLAAAQRRGGLVPHLSLDVDAAEAWLAAGADFDPARDAEREFDRRWARIVMERALARLEAQYADRAELYAALKRSLTADDDTRQSEIAATLGVSATVVKVTLHRMRAKFRELLRSEVAATVCAPHEVDGELRHLLELVAAD